MQKKNFVTLFNAYDVHLTKDVGLIPYGMYKYEGFDSYIATYDNGPYNRLNKDVKGLKIWPIQKRTGSFTLDSVAFILKNAKKIDVLNLYHSTVRTNILIRVFKILNKNGKIYLKLDDYYTKEDLPLWRRFYRGYCLKKSDYVSTELLSESLRMSKSFGKRIDYVPDPYNPCEETNFVQFKRRSNFILTVGRLGTPPKNTELLLKAYANVSEQLQNWELILVGPIDDQKYGFSDFLKKYFQKYPKLEGKIKFYGEIRERKQLIQIYENSKIFVLPSRWESFGIALTEAELHGDFIVCSDIPSFCANTDNYRFAYSFPSGDQNALENCLLKACKNKNIEDLAFEGYKYSKENFNLKYVCSKICKNGGMK